MDVLDNVKARAQTLATGAVMYLLFKNYFSNERNATDCGKNVK